MIKDPPFQLIANFESQEMTYRELSSPIVLFLISSN